MTSTGRPFFSCDRGLPPGIARELRRRREGSDLVLFALTGWGQAPARERSMRAGCDEHLTKPVDPQRIDALLARPLDKLRRSNA